MKYFFIVNGRADHRARIDDDLEKQLIGTQIEYDVYHTKGIGDGIRFVRIYCDLHQDEEVTFVACGGSGTFNEVASGVVGFRKKYIAFMAYGATNDFIKHFPDRDFTKLQGILDGEMTLTDIIRANDNYSINVASVGFDAMVAFEGSRMIESGMDGVKAFKKAVFKCLLGNRYNRMVVYADGERLNRRSLLFCEMGNGSWCGGQYRCTPKAKTDDGLIEVLMLKTCSIFTFLKIMGAYEKGTHLDDPFCRKRIKYRQAKHLEITSKDLIYINLDGETTAATKFSVDILPKSVCVIMPPVTKNLES